MNANVMVLTRDFKQTIVDRVQRDPAFGKALLDEAASLFLNGEPDTACLIPRNLVTRRWVERPGLANTRDTHHRHLNA
jgi:hypothetical protein